MKNNCHYLILICLFLIPTLVFSSPGDTTWIQANNVQLDYYNNFDDTVQFPDNSKTYRKILMYFTLGKYNCPSGSQYCHQWDYDVENYIIKNGDTIEMNRFVTPYATSGWNRFNGNWKQPYVFDVTNFQPKLHDSAVVRIHYSGYSGGFTADVKFAFIEGTPPRNVLGIQTVYQQSNSYGNSADPINNHFPVESYTTPTGTKSATLKVLISGHGSDDNQCCEFMSHNYQIKLNTNQIANQPIWRNDCGLNELYPQGGTWLYNRANWCPGATVHPLYHPLTGINSGGMPFDLQMMFDNYSGSGSFGSYKTSAVVFYYGDFNKTLDASVDAIITPTNDPNYFRENPLGSKPKIEVKNTGKNTITSLQFTYGVKDSTQSTYTWTGTLLSNENKVITLDPVSALKNMSFQALTGVYQFNVNIVKVNNQTDDDATNNSMHSNFVVAPTWPSGMVLTLKTANIATNASGPYIGNPNQKWVITDKDGNVVKSRTSTNMDTKYIDTIGISTPGVYKLTLTTDNGFGLHWWPYDGQAQVHQGFFKLKDMQGNLIPMKNYVYSGQQQDDWGSSYSQYFTINPEALSTHEFNQNPISVYPNPTNKELHVNIGNDSNGEILLTNMMGQIVFHKSKVHHSLIINVSSIDPGVYVLTFNNGNTRNSKRIVVEK